MLSGGAVQAGLLQPLLQMMRPKLERELADQCEALAKQALQGAELDLEPLQQHGEAALSGVGQTCQYMPDS